MRDTMVEQYKEALNSTGSAVVVSAPKGTGLTTTWWVSMQAADKFVRDFQMIEPENEPEPEVININPNFYGGQLVWHLRNWFARSF